MSALPDRESGHERKDPSFPAFQSRKKTPCCKPWQEGVTDRTFIYYPASTGTQENPEGWAVTEPGSVIIYGMKFCPFCGTKLTPPPRA